MIQIDKFEVTIHISNPAFFSVYDNNEDAYGIGEQIQAQILGLCETTNEKR